MDILAWPWGSWRICLSILEDIPAHLQDSWRIFLTVLSDIPWYPSLCSKILKDIQGYATRLTDVLDDPDRYPRVSLCVLQEVPQDYPRVWLRISEGILGYPGGSWRMPSDIFQNFEGCPRIFCRILGGILESLCSIFWNIFQGPEGRPVISLPVLKDILR